MTPISYSNGETVNEKMIQGKKFQWCGKRWSTTHSTGSHGLNKQESKLVVAPSAGLSLIDDTSLWLTKVDFPVEPVSPTWGSLWKDVLKLMLDLLVLCKPNLLFTLDA